MPEVKFINSKSNPLISLEIEKICLGALFKYNNSVWAEVSAHVNEECFSDQNNIHKIIFLNLRKYLDKGENFDKVLIANDIKNLKISSGDIDIFEYCDILSSTQVTKEGAIKSFQELVKLKIARELVNTSEEARKFVITNISKPLSEIIAGVDKLNNEKINTYNTNEEPVDLYDGISELVYDKGNNPQSEIGITTGFSELTALIGGIRTGNGLYAVVSRPKSGKSSFLRALVDNIVLFNPDVKCLILDTEMSTSVSRLRTASSITDVPMWFLETGCWNKSVEYAKRVKEHIDKTKQFKNRVYHMTVPNRPIDEICSIIKRWYHKNVGRGNRAVIVYDYIKLTGESVTKNWSEYQAIGDKINYLNEVGAKLDVGILTAMQLNRSAEGDEGVDDSSAIASSDRLQWYCAFNAILRKKSIKELTEDGLEFGTHKMIPLAMRFQGKSSVGHSDIVNVGTKKAPKYKNNFINYNIENFRVEEKGTLKTIIEKKKEIHDIKGDDNNEEESLL